MDIIFEAPYWHCPASGREIINRNPHYRWVLIIFSRGSHLTRKNSFAKIGPGKCITEAFESRSPQGLDCSFAGCVDEAAFGNDSDGV